jgi:Fe-S-cluster containining protein
MDEQQEALKRIHDKMIFDCLNEALDSKRVLGLKGCPLPVNFVSLFSQNSFISDKKDNFIKIQDLTHTKSRALKIKSHILKSQNSRSDNLTESSGKMSKIKNSISRSQTKYSNFDNNKENQMENSGVSSQVKFNGKKQNCLSKIFEKTGEQIKKWALFMCGMYEHKPENFKYFPEIINPMIFERIKESRMNLLEMNEMEELTQKMNDFDDEKYEITLNLNDLILEHLVSDLCSDLRILGKPNGNKKRTSLADNLKVVAQPNEKEVGVSPLNTAQKQESSNIIATEDVLTKLDYFPNYSYMKTDRSDPSKLLVTDSLIKTDENSRKVLETNCSGMNKETGRVSGCTVFYFVDILIQKETSKSTLNWTNPKKGNL